MDIGLTKHLCIWDRLMIFFIYHTGFLHYLQKNLLHKINHWNKTGDMNPILSMSHRLIKVFNKSATFCDSALMGQINFTQKPFFVWVSHFITRSIIFAGFSLCEMDMRSSIIALKKPVLTQLNHFYFYSLKVKICLLKRSCFKTQKTFIFHILKEVKQCCK